MTGVAKGTVQNVQKKGIPEEEVIEECYQIAETMKEANSRFTTRKSNKKDFHVREIDKEDGSSAQSMLLDCKEQYVRNERIILRLNYEVEAQESLMGGTKTGNFQADPRLAIMEKYQKVNIALRNQIIFLEKQLGISTETDEDPFA